MMRRYHTKERGKGVREEAMNEERTVVGYYIVLPGEHTQAKESSLSWIILFVSFFLPSDMLCLFVTI